MYENAKQRSKKRLDNLQMYRDWLLQLTICDPACGSGAFLNQALEFLIAEHRYLDELSATYNKDALVLSDIENSILENNLYGVDINQESVEIAKLSLWLRTAQRGRKLTSLSSNIKCGNSLIDAVKVAGDKAFKWEKEFPQVFAKGGFDVVIGNPPYVRAELLTDFLPFFNEKYEVFHPSSDLFAYFYELGSKLIRPSIGMMGFISNTFDKTTAGAVLREYLSSKTKIHNYIDFTEVQIFEGATTYPVIITLSNNDAPKNTFEYTKIPKEKKAVVIDINEITSVQVAQFSLVPSSWSFQAKQMAELFTRISKLESVRDKYGKCYYGVKTALNDAFIVSTDWAVSDHIKPIYEGKELKKWHTPPAQQQLLLFKKGWTKNQYEAELSKSGTDITEENILPFLERDFPALFEHLLPYKEKAIKRYDKGEFWWELRNCAYYHLFEKPKIVFPNLQNSNKFSLDSSGVFINAPAVFLPIASKTLLCILNSKLVWTFLKSICVVRSGGYIEVKPQYFEQIPIPPLANEAQFEERCDQIIVNTETIQQTQQSLLQVLTNRYPMEKLSGKLQNWPSLDFKGFLKELQKAKVKLSLAEEAEWMPYFNQQKQQVQALQAQIDTLDKEIDQMVYALYGLTEEETEVVEASC